MRKVGLSSQEQLNARHFIENGGRRLLDIYNGSPQAILASLSIGLNSKSDMNLANKSNQAHFKLPHRYWVHSPLHLFYHPFPLNSHFLIDLRFFLIINCHVYL
jgi:hypothetical protein